MRDAGTKSLQVPNFLADAKQTTPIEVGLQVGRYQLLVPIARGGMAEVWVVRLLGELGFSRIFALKTIRSEFAGDPSFRERFFEEARIAARLRHTNIVEVVDLGEEGSILFQVMTLVEGDSLAALMRARPERTAFDPAIAARIVGDALAGLHAAHELIDDHGTKLELVHRDISPHNILVGIDGVSKLTDFGVAKVLGGLPDDLLFGEVRGKPGYLAPEQNKKQELDRRADLFSAGVVLWELLTGRKLYTGEIGVAPDVRDFAPKVPKALAAMVMKSLRLERNERYSTALEMSDALENAVRPASARDVAKIALELCGAHVDAMRDAVRRAELGGGQPAAAIAAALAQPVATVDGSTDETVLLPPPDRKLAAAAPKAPLGLVLLPIAAAIIAGLVLLMDREEQPAQEISAPAIVEAPIKAPVKAPIEAIETATISLDIGEARGDPPPQPQRRTTRRDKQPKPKPKFKNPYQ